MQPITQTEPIHPGRGYDRFIIKSRFQLKFGLYISVFLGLASVLIWWQGNWALKNLLASGSQLTQEMISHIEVLNGMYWRTNIIVLAVAFGLSLLFSHQIAGPIYRFEETFKELKKGNLNVHIRLRKNDELKELAHLFNEALSALRHKDSSQQKAIVSAVQEAQILASALRQSGQLKEAESLEKIISSFKPIS
jgi:methyl-accepting chemotaxis protein